VTKADRGGEFYEAENAELDKIIEQEKTECG
jgi:hypothetical protein